MQVILREDVDNLGKRGQVVRVATGYARNYLMRRNLAVEATPGNFKTFELQREALALREQKEKGDSEIVAAELEKWEAVISRKAGESGALFGSVTAANLCDLLAAKGIRIDRRKIHLREPIKALGSYTISIRLHREVTAAFPLHVVSETQKEHEGIRERQIAPPPQEGTPETAAPAAAEALRGEETPRKEPAEKKPGRKKRESTDRVTG